MGGGMRILRTNFIFPILNDYEIKSIISLAKRIRYKLPRTFGVDFDGPYDVEFGFSGGKLWLFQVRPFVENKLALSSKYLKSLDPVYPGDLMIDLNEDADVSGCLGF